MLTYSLNVVGSLASEVTYDATSRSIGVETANTALLTNSPYTYTVNVELTKFSGYGTGASSKTIKLEEYCIDGTAPITMDPMDDQESKYTEIVYFDIPNVYETGDSSGC